jgi:nucleoside-diphosphate-sugar epimerase
MICPFYPVMTYGKHIIELVMHADDVAQAFLQALVNWRSAVGESFHIVSPTALTLRGYAEAMASWFGQPAQLRFVSWDADRGFSN